LAKLTKYDNIPIDDDDEGPGLFSLFKDSDDLRKHQQDIAKIVSDRFQFTKN
jgi:hypothetical protein